MSQVTRQKPYVVGMLVLLLAGCAATPATVAPRFNGVWVNADLRVHSWLEVEAQRVVNFGFIQAEGHCAATSIDIVARDRVIVPVSALGSGPMSLRLDADALVITGKYATQRYVRASRESICRGSGGAYVPGAPYSKPGS